MSGKYNSQVKEKFQKLLDCEIVKKLILAIKFFTTKRVITAASALTYSTILSLVPICAVVFAIARGFGFTIHIEGWFRHLLSSQPQAADLIIGFVNSYLEHAKSGIILGIGLVFMLYTIVMLTRDVEQTFNDIWHVGNRKNIMRTFTDYLAIFFLVPIVIIIMSGITLFLSTLAAQSEWAEFIGPLMQFVLDLIPFLLMWLCFTALYVFMPNTQVRFKYALVPGLLAAVAMTLLQWFYINAQMFISNYNAIYGSFAALPLFMLWVQFSWTICLFGAELCFTNQNLEEFAVIDGASTKSHNYRILVSLLLLGKICRQFDSAEKPYSAVDLKKGTGISISIVRDLLYNMVRLNILTEIFGQNSGTESRFQPAVSLTNLTVGSVVEKLEGNGTWDITVDFKPEACNAETLEQILQIRRRYISDMSQIQMKDF